MDKKEIEHDIRSFITDNFLLGRAKELRDDQSLLGTVIDSTGSLELVGFLQDHFDIVVEDQEVVPENLDSVKNVVAYVAKKLQSKA